MNTRVVSMLMLVAVLTSYAVSTALADDEVYLFALNHYNNKMEYLDEETNQVSGFYADIVDAVCELADKNCKLVVDEYNHCWETPADGKARGGVGLMSQWYTACTSWLPTYARSLTFDFTKPIKKMPKVSLYAAKGSSTVKVYSDLSGLKVGFLEAWFTDAACLARYTANPSHPIVGADLPSHSQMYYDSSEDLIDALQNEEVDVIFGPSRPELDAALTKISPPDFVNHCAKSGSGMMTTKDNTDFISWWDTAFDTLVGSNRYALICQNLEDLNQHGRIPGDLPSEVCIGY